MFRNVELGVFEEITARKLLQLHTYDHYKDDGKILPGYKYKVYLPVHENRSIETIGMLYDSQMNLLYKFNARYEQYSIHFLSTMETDNKLLLLLLVVVMVF
jgi:hypothetical protein